MEMEKTVNYLAKKFRCPIINTHPLGDRGRQTFLELAGPATSRKC